MKRRTIAQLLADNELDGVRFILKSVERCLKQKRLHTVTSIMEGTYVYEESTFYLWRFESIERRYIVFLAIRSTLPDEYKFEVEYPWSSLRLAHPHINDYGRLTTRI